MFRRTPKKIYTFFIRHSPVKRCRPVYFVVTNYAIGSSITRGYIISNELLKLGVYSQVLELIHDGERLAEIKNAFVVLIKDAVDIPPGLMETIVRAGNILIWDPLDGIEDNKDHPHTKNFAGVIVSSDKMKQDYEACFKSACRFHVLHHHWDPRCCPNTARDFRLVYVGDPTPDNILAAEVEQFPELMIEKIKSYEDIKRGSFFERMRNYSCHFSVRSDQRRSFYYKPNAKLAFAAGMKANIVLSREPANMALLDADYPFYADSTVEDAVAKIKLARESFGSQLWNGANSMILDVREKTRPSNIAKCYFSFLKSL